MKFKFEVEERELYRFNIEAKDRDQAIRLFHQHPDLYLTEQHLEDVNLDYEIIKQII